MTIRLREALMHELGALRYEPTEKRIRGTLGDQTVIDSRRALLVWEPKRVVPTYAVPLEDVNGEIVAAPDDAPDPPPGIEAIGAPQLGAQVVLDPSIPFSVHTAEGESIAIRAPGGHRAAAGFRPSDPDLADHVLVDFDGFDAWYEEDERNVAHPRDPFHRIDILHSSRHVHVEVDGVVLGESANPYLLFEPPLPVRYYLPAEHVRTDMLQPSDTGSYCAYKGEASYWSVTGNPDVAWTYRQPLREATEITGRIAFFNERVDLVVDGEPLERPITPWSPRST
ncbi:MAG: DUF427 domain-containing protein [Acidimicrobiales bacterium]